MKPVPLIVTVVPTGPEVGESEEMVGFCVVATEVTVMVAVPTTCCAGITCAQAAPGGALHTNGG